jgi:hypothetical protein
MRKRVTSSGSYSAPETEAELAGRAGYVLVRNGRIVADALTSMN